MHLQVIFEEISLLQRLSLMSYTGNDYSKGHGRFFMDISIKDMEDKGLITKKTEKLVTAIYMLTSFFDEKEPMKWRLRELSNRLLSQNENHQIVQEVLSLLSVGKFSGLISDMNYNLISQEFSRLLPSALTLHDLFSKDDAEPEATSKIAEKQTLYIASSVQTLPVASQQIKDKIRESQPTGIERKPLKEFGAIAVKKNSRQSIIINLLKRKKEIMIKDVSPLIEGVSEKTIQRELLSMVSAGILKKMGEKRWSRYSLAE